MHRDTNREHEAKKARETAKDDSQDKKKTAQTKLVENF